MATYDLTKGSTDKLPDYTKKTPFSAAFEVDFSEQNAVQSDEVVVGRIPAGHVITAVAAEVVTAEGEAATVDIGNAATQALFYTDLDVNTAGWATPSTVADTVSDSEIQVIVTAKTAAITYDAAVVKVNVCGYACSESPDTSELIKYSS